MYMIMGIYFEIWEYGLGCIVYVEKICVVLWLCDYGISKFWIWGICVFKLLNLFYYFKFNFDLFFFYIYFCLLLRFNYLFIILNFIKFDSDKWLV